MNSILYLSWWWLVVGVGMECVWWNDTITIIVRQHHCHQTISAKTPSMYQLSTIYTPYPWRGNSYSSRSQERREWRRVSGITIRFHQTIYIFHCTRHTILKATSSSRTVVPNSRYTVICVPSHPYQHDPIIWNNQQHHPIVRLCLEYWCSKYPRENGWARTQTHKHEHGRDNKFNKEDDIIID